MKCYDCGGLIAPGADKCPACNCPAERMQAVKCLETRLLTARVEAESALDQLGRAKVAMLCAAFFALVGGVVVLVHAGGDATMRAVGIFMAALACVYAALAFLVRKAPLTLSIAGFLLSWLCLGGFPGLVIVGAMALSLWFAVQYVRITNRVGLLERKIAELDIPAVYEILKTGSEKAEAVAAQTLKEVKAAMKINYFEDQALIASQIEKFAK